MSDESTNVQSGRMSTPEPARFLARGVGYVNSPAAGLFAEPEALSQVDQADITRAAHERVQDARRHELRMQAERAEKSRAHFEAQMRHCERQLSRLQRQLAAG